MDCITAKNSFQSDENELKDFNHLASPKLNFSAATKALSAIQVYLDQVSSINESNLDLIEHLDFELNDAGEKNKKQTNLLSFFNKICKIYIFIDINSSSS